MGDEDFATDICLYIRGEERSELLADIEKVILARSYDPMEGDDACEVCVRMDRFTFECAVEEGDKTEPTGDVEFEADLEDVDDNEDVENPTKFPPDTITKNAPAKDFDRAGNQIVKNEA
jgi:hypothetical protein